MRSSAHTREAINKSAVSAKVHSDTVLSEWLFIPSCYYCSFYLAERNQGGAERFSRRSGMEGHFWLLGETAMKNLTKHLIRAGVIGASLMTMTPLAASAGEWRINVRACPDLREDRIDRRYDNDRR